MRIPYQATIALQKRDLTLSDTYGIWLEMKLHLEKIITAKATNVGLDVMMLEKFESRYNDIFDHPAMKAAIFLDPRYRQGLNQDDIIAAKEFIIQTQQRLNFFKNRHLRENDISNTANELSDDSNDSISISFDAQAAISGFLGHNDENIDSQNITLGPSDIEAALDLFNPRVIPIKESILKFWAQDDGDYDELRDVAAAIFAIPPTETHVERDFSALKFIFSDRRNGLSDETLENILCIYLNKEMYLTVNKKQIQKMEESL